MVMAQGLGDEDRQAPRDEEGDRGAGASVGRDHVTLFHRVLGTHDGRAVVLISEEKREPASDINAVMVDSLKALDPINGRLEKQTARSPCS
jgi:hypothetical protein